MSVNAKSRLDGNEFKAYWKLAKEYGAKAAGLLVIPSYWTPKFMAITIDLFAGWIKDGRLDDEILGKIFGWIDANSCSTVIIRSSGVNERIGDRGKFVSVIISAAPSEKLIRDAICEVFQKSQLIDSSETLGLVVQEYVTPRVSGHLSNEVRVSPTRNQWKYETEKPWLPTKGLNSKFAVSPDPEKVILCGNQIPHQTLRSVGKWLTGQIGPRCHVEWITSQGQFFLVQLDMEWREQDRGIDPTEEVLIKASRNLDLNAANILTKYEVGVQTSWKKLKNLSDFDFCADVAAPRIYFLNGAELVSQTSSPTGFAALVAEIYALTGNRVVVRTDCKNAAAGQFNLPRTDTVTAEEAVSWCFLQLGKLHKRGIVEDEIAFLLHAFIPSRASAWAYASPDTPTVIVDALWGLPDGLQVLPVDSYEMNVPKGQYVPTRSTFKPRYLRELDDGKWVYEDVMRTKGRSTVLPKSDVEEIARRTYSIAKKLGEDAQIMWFSGIPEEYGLGRNLPWYRSREKLDQAPRTEIRYKAYKVRNPSDLDRLPDRQAMIKLSPEANLIRNDDFLQKVIDAAKAKRLPVELEGSMLGHTYYRLSQAGVAVVLSNVPKYHRVRQRKVFGKLVRDRIPANIFSGGESVIEAKLIKTDEKHGLAGKLVEELEEFLLADSQANKAAELADLLEVLMGLANNAGFPWNSVIESASKKREKRGGFLERRVLLETSLPPKNGPLESHRAVSISELGSLEQTERGLRIPLTALINSIGRSELVIQQADGPNTFSFKIKDGRLEVKIGEQKKRSEPEQGTLFD